MLGDIVGVVAVDGVPGDREGHRQELEQGGAFDGELGAVAGLADAGLVFGFFETHFDRPTVGVALDELRGGGVKVGGDQRELVPEGFVSSLTMITRTGVSGPSGSHRQSSVQSFSVSVLP